MGLTSFWWLILGLTNRMCFQHCAGLAMGRWVLRGQAQAGGAVCGVLTPPLLYLGCSDIWVGGMLLMLSVIGSAITDMK